MKLLKQMPHLVALYRVHIGLLLNLIHIQVHTPSKHHPHNQNRMDIEGIYVKLPDLVSALAQLLKEKLGLKASVRYSPLELMIVLE